VEALWNRTPTPRAAIVWNSDRNAPAKRSVKGALCAPPKSAKALDRPFGRRTGAPVPNNGGLRLPPPARCEFIWGSDALGFEVGGWFSHARRDFRMASDFVVFDSPGGARRALAALFSQIPAIVRFAPVGMLGAGIVEIGDVMGNDAAMGSGDGTRDSALSASAKDREQGRYAANFDEVVSHSNRVPQRNDTG
jgi:hypothetical protein